jgi:FKBP12-rapamycin complex-associated protein
MVMQAIMFIFNTLGLRCVPFLERVVPHILHTIRTCGQASLREALLQQIATLSTIVRDHLRPYVPDIFDVIEEFWTSRHLATVLALVSKMAAGLPDDFRKFVPRLIKKLLATIESLRVADWIGSSNPRTDEVEKLELILRNIRGIRRTLADYMHLLVPALVKLADSLTVAIANVSAAGSSGLSQGKLTQLGELTFQTLSVVLQTDAGRRINGAQTPMSSSSSLPARAAQPLTRMLSGNPSPNRTIGIAIVEALCVCARELGPNRWMNFYHRVARDSIVAWQRRIGMGANGMSIEGGAVNENVGGQLHGLALYDKIISDLVGSNPKIAPKNPSITANGVNRNVSSESYNGPSFGGAYSSIAAFENLSEILDGNMRNNPSMHPIVSQNIRRIVNKTDLQRAWDVSQRASREDWDEWIRRFGDQLLREAPSPALRAAASLAHVYQPLARELFSAAFLCCWDQLDEQYRENLVHSLQIVFEADVSPEILQTLLNLAKFMEHDSRDGGLPIDIAVLGKLAIRCRAYAKALHYKEREHDMGGGGACLDDLISINKKLDLPGACRPKKYSIGWQFLFPSSLMCCSFSRHVDVSTEAALGVLKAAQVDIERNCFDENDSFNAGEKGRFSSQFLKRHQGQDMLYSVVSKADVESNAGSWDGIVLHESWLAKLGSWAEALDMYEQKLKENPNDTGAVLGCMRCLDARGEWRQVIKLFEESNWSAVANVETHANSPKQAYSYRKALKFCAQAAWRLREWDQLDDYSSELVGGEFDSSATRRGTSGLRDGGIPLVDFDGAFYSAVLHINREEWTLAAEAIDAARRAMDSRFTALMAESYKRSYPSMVTAQTLAEMEEIVAFRKLESRAKASANRHPANRADVETARRALLSVWRSRLAGCRVDMQVHSSILAVRSLVLGPTDEVEATLTLSAMSRQAQCQKLAERVLLDPLVELGADLNGPIFGFRAPRSLGLGLQHFKAGLETDDHVDAIEKLIIGPQSFALPRYGPPHEAYIKGLIKQTGGNDR